MMIDITIMYKQIKNISRITMSITVIILPAIVSVLLN